MAMIPTRAATTPIDVAYDFRRSDAFSVSVSIRHSRAFVHIDYIENVFALPRPLDRRHSTAVLLCMVRGARVLSLEVHFWLSARRTTLKRKCGTVCPSPKNFTHLNILNITKIEAI